MSVDPTTPSRMTGSSTGGAVVTLALDDAALERLADLVAQRLLPTLTTSSTSGDRWLDSREAAGYLGLSVTALHKLTATRAIPFAQDRPGARCWFKRSALDD